MTRTERRQGGFTAEQSAVRYEKNYLNSITPISARMFADWLARSGRCSLFRRVVQLVERLCGHSSEGT